MLLFPWTTKDYKAYIARMDTQFFLLELVCLLKYTKKFEKVLLREFGNLEDWLSKPKKENHPDGTFTMRWTCSGVTVEKIYPFSFNKFEKVLLLDEYKVRKSKLYYMRNKIWKDARLKSIITADNRDSDLLKKVKTFDAPKSEVKEVKEEKVEAPVEPQAPEAPATEAAE